MKKTLIIISLIYTTTIVAQTKLYVHPDAKTYVANTKTIAILPLKVQVKLRPKELKEFTEDQITEMGRDEALDIHHRNEYLFHFFSIEYLF